MSDILKIELFPDLEKIKNYLFEAQIIKFKQLGKVEMELGLTKEQYDLYSQTLKRMFKKYDLGSLTDELLFVIFSEEEILSNTSYDDKLRFQDIDTAIDVSNFLLAIKNSKDNPLFQIGVKENTGTIYKPNNKNYFIKNEEVSKWMCQLIVDALETGNYPLGVLGETFSEWILGINFSQEKNDLSIEKLERGASLKNKSYKVYFKKRLAEFCFNIQYFLEIHTELKSPKGIKVTDLQANFFFEVLCAIEYLDADKIGSEPKDFISQMLRNHRW